MKYLSFLTMVPAGNKAKKPFVGQPYHKTIARFSLLYCKYVTIPLGFILSRFTFMFLHLITLYFQELLFLR